MKVYVTKNQAKFYDDRLFQEYREEALFLAGLAKDTEAMYNAYWSNRETELISVPDSDPRLGTFEV